MPIGESSVGEQVLTDNEEELGEPEEYRVVLLNDNYTTMEFVVSVLMTVFHKGISEATRIMIDVHKKGRGIVGTYSFDIAVTKINQVHELARQNEYPLKCTIEKV
jgi:ATP-dependent Clp protease adaptor protein ClpS